MCENDAIIREFISECRDMIDDVEPKLIELHKDAAETGEVCGDTVNTIFRTFHSIKGSTGYLEFNVIKRLTHNAETLLDLFRKGKARLASEHTDILCQALDFVREALDEIELQGSDLGKEAKADRLIDNLQAMILDAGGTLPKATKVPATKEKKERASSSSPEEEKSESGAPEGFGESLITAEMRGRFITESADLLTQSEQMLLELADAPDNATDIITDAFRLIHSFKGNCGFMGLVDLERLSHSLETVMERVKTGGLKCSGHVLDFMLKTVDTLESGLADISQGGSGAIEECDKQCRQLADLKSGGRPEAGARKTTTRLVRSDIRVDLEKMDRLVNLIGELVIAEAMVVNNPDLEGYEFERFERAAGHMNRIVRDLQDVAMSVRMVPLSDTFRKMIRLVHDVASKAGKKVDLLLKGEETEIDRTVAELIADPLLHIIRNAVDHGIDSAEEREEAGKSESGRILLEARHEGGEVWVIVRDDGRGLDRDKILSKAMELGIVQSVGTHMTETEIWRLIFEPGFTTADEVTDVSGRGVGMDVVKKNIEMLNGSVDVYSQPGKGTMFVLRFPLTMAIIEGMLIRVGKARYTLPILAVRESIRVDEDSVTTTMDGQEIIKLRDELIPVVRLCELHRVEPDFEKISSGILVVMENQAHTVALFVDEILGQHQAVIKGLSDYIGSVKSVAGCTILGDGDISLILDPAGIYRMAEQVDRSALVKEACMESG
jgi:two-component system chemotaxis sensor kinase CheA